MYGLCTRVVCLLYSLCTVCVHAQCTVCTAVGFGKLTRTCVCFHSTRDVYIVCPMPRARFICSVPQQFARPSAQMPPAPDVVALCLSEGLGKAIAALPRRGVVELVAIADRDVLGTPVCVEYADLLACMIDLNQDHLWQSVPITQQAVNIVRERHYICQGLSCRQLVDWCRWESNKIRLLYAYLVRLCRRSEWSHNLVIARLKDRFWSRPGTRLRRPPSSGSVASCSTQGAMHGTPALPAYPDSPDKSQPRDEIDVLSVSSGDVEAEPVEALSVAGQPPALAPVQANALPSCVPAQANALPTPPVPVQANALPSSSAEAPEDLPVIMEAAADAARSPVDHKAHKRRLVAARAAGPLKKRPAAAPRDAGAAAAAEPAVAQPAQPIAGSAIAVAAAMQEPELDAADVQKILSLNGMAHVAAEPRADGRTRSSLQRGKRIWQLMSDGRAVCQVTDASHGDGAGAAIRILLRLYRAGLTKNQLEEVKRDLKPS